MSVVIMIIGTERDVKIKTLLCERQLRYKTDDWRISRKTIKGRLSAHTSVIIIFISSWETYIYYIFSRDSLPAKYFSWHFDSNFSLLFLV